MLKRVFLGQDSSNIPTIDPLEEPEVNHEVKEGARLSVERFLQVTDWGSSNMFIRLMRFMTLHFSAFSLPGINFWWSDWPQSTSFSVPLPSWQTPKWRGPLWRCVGSSQWTGLFPHSWPRGRRGNTPLLPFNNLTIWYKILNFFLCCWWWKESLWTLFWVISVSNCSSEKLLLNL